MVKHRLFFGTVMTVFFVAVALFDSWLDGSLTSSAADDKKVQATILFALVAVLVVLAHFEMSRLAAAKNLRIFIPLSGTISVLFAAGWYLPQILEISAQAYFYLLSAFSLMALLLFQYITCGTSGVLANCGANCFSIFYLGLLIAFVLAVRIDFGVWHLLMFVLVVKSADIGAYAGGSLFGKHKFSPRISPGKTWEGMAAAIVAATIVAVCFAVNCDIMTWWLAVIFGTCFAFIGQMGDLAESMIKRDAEKKDSASHVPGFGGLLDIIDSPLVAAPFAYLFFVLTAGRRPW